MRARGRAFSGERISSATVLAFCQPPYEKRIGTRAAAKARSVAGRPLGVRAIGGSGGSLGASHSPPRMSAASERILISTSPLSTRLPGLTPRTLTSAMARIAAMARGVGLAPGDPAKRRVCSAKTMETAAMPPPWIIRNDAQPKRKATSGW